jgi:sugar transferase EpsL
MAHFYTEQGKRIFDLAIILSAIVILWLPFAIIACLVRVNLGTPVLFRQIRPGRFNKPFELYKFRTMTYEYDNEDHPLPDETRLTSFGKSLRNTSLDELPELFNVIKGNMSIVGPRPLLRQYLKRYSNEQARRHEVEPGITGWAQINGRNAISWEEKFALDVWYVDHVCLSLDLKIIALSIWKIIKREGINQPGQATAEEFNPKITQDKPADLGD